LAVGRLGWLLGLALLAGVPTRGSAQLPTSGDLTRALQRELGLTDLGTTGRAPAIVCPRPSCFLQDAGDERLLRTLLWTAGGGVAGALVGASIAQLSTDPGVDAGAAILGLGALGYLAGTTVGSAIGGSRDDPDRSFGGAFLRSLAAGVAVVGVGALMDGDGAFVGIVAGVPLAQIFAVLL